MTKRYSTSYCSFTGLCLGFLLLYCGGCSRPKEQVFPPLETPLIWPNPPEQGRVRFVGTISTAENLRREVTWTQGLSELIFGKEEVGVLRGPSAVVVGPHQTLYIADGPGRAIHMFTLTKRRYQQFSSLGADRTLMMPVALTIVGERLYIVDSVLHDVCIFDDKGNFHSSFGSVRFVRPSGIAYCPKRDRLYVSDTARHVIDVFDKNGEFIETMAVGALATVALAAQAESLRRVVGPLGDPVGLRVDHAAPPRSR